MDMELVKTIVGAVITGLFTWGGIWLAHYLKNRKPKRTEEAAVQGVQVRHKGPATDEIEPAKSIRQIKTGTATATATAKEWEFVFFKE